MKSSQIIRPQARPTVSQKLPISEMEFAPQKRWISEVSEFGNTLKKNGRRCTKKIPVSCNDTSIFSTAWSSA